MSHMPVNHPLRPFYRVLAALSGVYVLVFGLVGAAMTAGQDFFARSDTSALGLRTNLAFSLLSIVAGIVVIGAVVIGRNVDRAVNVWGGLAFLTVGTVMLLLLDSDLNALNFSMATVIVSFLVGMILFSAGLYGRTATRATPSH